MSKSAMVDAALYADRWRSTRTSVATVDRAAAESAVAEAYVRAGLKEPIGIIWCDSPIMIERSRKSLWYDLRPGRSVKSEVFDQSITRGLRIVYGLSPQICNNVVSAFTPRRSSRSTTIINDVINREALRVRWGLASLARLAPRNWGKASSYADFDISCWAPYASHDALGVTEFVHDHIHAHSDLASMAPLWKLAANVGWVVAHERVCWLSERWSTYAVDANSRLHRSDGPAVTLRDGTAFHFWKNIEVPAWTIEARHRITPSRIDVQSNPLIRRCMIEMITPAVYVASGGARKVGTDATGTLWVKQWSSVDVWAAVEVVNGTPGPDGRYEHYFLQVPGHHRTPLDGVAWSYGIDPDTYAKLVYRT